MPAASLSVHATPKAPKDAIVGWHGDALKLKVRAVAEEGKANEALCRFIAKSLGISKSAVQIRSGKKSRRKLFTIEGLTQEKLTVRLGKLTRSQTEHITPS